MGRVRRIDARIRLQVNITDGLCVRTVPVLAGAATSVPTKPTPPAPKEVTQALGRFSDLSKYLVSAELWG